MGEFTVLPDGVFGLWCHHAEASPTVFPFQVSVWSQQAERSRPLGHSRFVKVMVDGQRLLLTFRLLSLCAPKKREKNGGECKAIGPVPGHLEKFWWRTPRIPGISRVFQSYMVWDLGTPRSQKGEVMTKPSPGTRNKGGEAQSGECFEYSWKSWQQRNSSTAALSHYPQCTSSLKSEHIINVFQGEANQSSMISSRLQN